MTELHRRWAKAYLSDVCSINPRVDKTKFDPASVVSFVPMSAVEAETGNIDVSETRTFQRVCKGYTPFRQGDVLFAKITPCMENGKMAIVPELASEYGFGSTEFHVLRPFFGIDSQFIYHAVSSRLFRSNAEHKMTGAVGQKRVPDTVLKQHEIGLPPINEQRRIVEKIEGLFAEIDKGVESLKAAKASLDHYRKSLLKAAFEGRLTADWREKTPDRIKNTDDLIVRIQKQNRKVAREETRNRQKLPPTWCRTTVAEISDPLRYGYTASADPEADGPKLLRITDIQNGNVRWHHVPRCVIPAQKLDQFLLSAGDIVFARTGGTVGKSFLIREVPESSIFASYLVPVRKFPTL